MHERFCFINPLHATVMISVMNGIKVTIKYYRTAVTPDSLVLTLGSFGAVFSTLTLPVPIPGEEKN